MNRFNTQHEKHWSSTASIWLGGLSVFLWDFSIIPVLAIVFGSVSLKEEGSNWRAWVGIVLGVLYIMTKAYHLSK